MATLSVSDASKLTLTQLRTQIAPTKRDALILLNGGSDRVSDAPVITWRKNGQVESQTIVIRDIEGALISTTATNWTYYDKEPGAPVDTITIVEKDAKDIESAWSLIKHFLDKQPIRFTGREEYQKFVDKTEILK
jgi:hypothetical protein